MCFSCSCLYGVVDNKQARWWLWSEGISSFIAPVSYVFLKFRSTEASANGYQRRAFFFSLHRLESCVVACPGNIIELMGEILELVINFL